MELERFIRFFKCGNEGKKILYRLLFCVLSISLLWTTTLSAAIFLVKSFITFPSYSEIYDSCKFAYDITVTQEENFVDCGRRQLSSCNNIYGKSLSNELNRVNTMQTANDVRLSQVSNLLQVSTSNITIIQHSLNTFSSIEDNTIPFLSNTSKEDISRVEEFVGYPISSKNGIADCSQSYVESSSGVTSHISAYTKETIEYNVKYIADKTTRLNVDTMSAVGDVSSYCSLHMLDSFDDLTAKIREYSACVSLDSTTATPCKLRFNMSSEYNTLSNSVDRSMTAFKASFVTAQRSVDTYILQAQRAVDQAQSFYDAMAGVNGVVSYVTTSLAIPKSTLCSKGSSDWCSMSSGDWTLPSSLPLTFPNPITLPDAASIWSRLQISKTQLDTQIQTTISSIQKNTANWTSSLSAKVGDVDFAPSDYAPPPYVSYYDHDQSSSQQTSASDVIAADVMRNVQSSTVGAVCAVGDRCYSQHITICNSCISNLLLGFDLHYAIQLIIVHE